MISIQELYFQYSFKEKLFQGLSLELQKGNIYGLLGKNGAGKTTLLKIITGMLFRHKGICSVMGHDPSSREAEMLREIYFLPEEFYLPQVTGTEYVSYFSPFYPNFDAAAFSSSLETFEISPAKKLSEMSYGQKKKFLIAFGLAANCGLLLLDEPTNGLDIPAKSQFRKLMANSITDDRCFIISTHQVRDMEYLIDPVIILNEGTIVFEHTVEEISSKLEVRLMQKEEGEDAVYTEKIPGGFTVLTENRSGAETQIDVELLFNAVLKNPERIQQIFYEGDK